MDNGAVKAQFDAHKTYDELSQLASPEAAGSVVAWVQRFSSEANKARERGMHLGSDNLPAAVRGSFYDESHPGRVLDPKRFNLQTETEVKLIAKLVEGMVNPILSTPIPVGK